ncbi:MAG: hypothetical protein V3S69_07565 [Dehalococcoidales bacterium]
MDMETYHVGDTYPPKDILLTRKNEDNVAQYVDPSGATQIVVNVRINGVYSLKLSVNLSNNVSIVLDANGKNRVRIRWVEDDLDTEGIYQLQVVLTWSDGSETTPDPHDFKVIAKWI